jgi:dTDP-4-amino-4,6-dideoxygalactose transaminase
VRLVNKPDQIAGPTAPALDEKERIPFTRPHLTGMEAEYISEARAAGHFSGDGGFTKRCHAWLESQTGTARALLTHSCTGALEMSALLLDIAPGDEVIMPSYTFTSTANAFVLRGGVPVFADIRPDTLNIDETLIEAAITPRTRAIVVVHYAGVACEMDAIMQIAQRRGLKVVEDAAQGLLARYRGRALGSIGDLGTLSFHETKNIISGEGGALLVNDPALIGRAEIMREKGTDRSRFLRNEVDKYTWQDVGSSYLPSELIAAFLLAQLERAEDITAARRTAWRRYHQMLLPFEQEGQLSRPTVPVGSEHNAHLYYVLLPRSVDRASVLTKLNAEGIGAVFHYVPLHAAPAGRRYCRTSGELVVTEDVAERLVRLPLWSGISEAQQSRVVAMIESAITGNQA